MEREQLVTEIPLPNLEDPDIVDLNSDPENPKVITFEEVKTACERIANGILCTPCKEQAKRGVIACSLGNHALGLLYHGSLLKIPVTIIMPVNSSLMKQERCRRYGGLVLLKGNNMSESKLYASKIAKLNNLCLINGYDHPHIVAGQGTIGIEILEQVPDVDAIIVPVGGGGLLAGICVAVKSIRADVMIIAVESDLCPSFKEAMSAGKPVYTEDCLSSADGIKIYYDLIIFYLQRC
ncbi:L-threonine dehydratase catabolic TdcB [Schistosoma japonicum]|nr:L-threonine dehydratase catabolic TdcB [Schistosoma japonicum]KAH8863170.1 L-threonine dehydratase catabolic TdcB [Schistosoma japonicum]